jgi:hypothetical protein
MNKNNFHDLYFHKTTGTRSDVNIILGRQPTTNARHKQAKNNFSLLIFVFSTDLNNNSIPAIENISPDD